MSFWHWPVQGSARRLKLLWILSLFFLYPKIGQAQTPQAKQELTAGEVGGTEEEIYRVYKSFKPIDDEEWKSLVSGSGKNSWTVTAGDNLWNLSEIFFGEGHYWSKVWSYNENLTNPHLIRVGQQIQFFMGSIKEPPSVEIVDSKEVVDQKEAPMQDPSPKEGEVMGEVSIPPPREQVRPVQKIPDVFRKSKAISADRYGIKGVSMDLRPPAKPQHPIMVDTFIYDESVSNYPGRIGYVLESEDSKELLGLNDILYIQSEESLKLGEELTVMDEKYSINKGFIFASSSVIGYLARVRVTDILDDNRYRVEVFHSYGDVRRGAWVCRERVSTFSNNYQGRFSEIQLRILGGGTEKGSQIFGQNDVIFLNGGTEQGLKEGDILGIYSVRKNRYRRVKVRMAPNPIAHIKVFRVESQVASAFVLDSKDAILVGDQTGPPMLARQATSGF